jgi:4-hydroxybenzoate polyprenyltransferase
MWKTFQKLLELIRFSHTVFALPFAMLASVMAWTTPLPAGASGALGFQWLHLVAILICMVAARSAAMAFNRLVDRHWDAKNPRTAMRHLPKGDLSVGQVTLFTIGSSVLFLSGAALFLPNWLPLTLAIPVLLFLLGYSYAKRFTSLAHFWLGAALMAAPVCAWIALRGQVVLQVPLDLLPALLLGLCVFLWVSGFDLIYACQDAEFDKGAGLWSVPARYGIACALRLAAICHFGLLFVLAGLPLLCPQLALGWLYYLTIALVAGLLIYEHAIVRPTDLTRVNVAFFNVNAVISLGLFVATSIDLIW